MQVPIQRLVLLGALVAALGAALFAHLLLRWEWKRAFLFGIVAVVGIQFLFVGSAYPWLNCSAFADVTGALLIGLAPLMLAYLIVAALASLMASAPEK